MTFAKFMAKHYYITSVLIAIRFVGVITRWTTERSERQFREDLEATLLNQTVRIQNSQAMLQTLEDTVIKEIYLEHYKN